MKNGPEKREMASQFKPSLKQKPKLQTSAISSHGRVQNWKYDWLGYWSSDRGNVEKNNYFVEKSKDSLTQPRNKSVNIEMSEQSKVISLCNIGFHLPILCPWRNKTKRSTQVENYRNVLQQFCREFVLWGNTRLCFYTTFGFGKAEHLEGFCFHTERYFYLALSSMWWSKNQQES